MIEAARSIFEIKERLSSLIDSALANIPQDVADHLVNSQTEFLKAIRAVIDEQIATVERHHKRARDIQKKRGQGKK